MANRGLLLGPLITYKMLGPMKGLWNLFRANKKLLGTCWGTEYLDASRGASDDKTRALGRWKVFKKELGLCRVLEVEIGFCFL